MYFNNKVIWSEGLFLQPQHFQQQDRYLENIIIERENSREFTSWGLIEYEIDYNLLLVGKISFSRCKGIFPDGTIFDNFSNALLPDAVDVPLGSENLIIYISVLLKNSSKPEVAINEEEKTVCRYKSENYDVVDIISGSNNSAEMQLGKLILRIKFGNDNLDGFSYIPIARIKDILQTKKASLDENFIPACLNINFVNIFKKYNEFLAELIHRAKSKLHIKNKGISLKTNVDFLNFFLLLSLNRASATLQILMKKNIVHPERFYVFFVELASELATFNNEIQLQFIPDYKHDDLQSCFQPLLNIIQTYLLKIINSGAIELKLEVSNGKWICDLSQYDITYNSLLILSVETDMTNDYIIKEFPVFVKISNEQNIDELITYGLPGLAITYLQDVPDEVPYEKDYSYYLLNKDLMWGNIVESKNIVIFTGKEYLEMKLKLWLITDDKNE